MATNPFDASYDAVIEKAMKKWHIPGLSAAIVHNDQTWTKAYGLAQRSPEKPVDTKTLFYAASTTKAQLCAVWAIYMASSANTSKPADERITWKTKMVDLIGGDFVLEDPIHTREITLEDAVSHRTGMPRHDLCYGKEGPTNVGDVTRHLRHLPLHNALRTQFEYCNLMYMAATHALETVTGKDLSEIFREWLWEPLGMRQTYTGYGEAARAVEERGEVLARSYYWTKLPGTEGYEDGESRAQAYMDFPEVSGAGEIISTAEDYAKWMRCLLSSASPLSRDMLKELWTPRAVITDDNDMSAPFDGEQLAYALGWFTCSYRGYKCVYHPGGIIGAGSLVFLVPELKWGMCYFGNGNDVGMTLRGLPFAVLDGMLGVGGREGGLERVEQAVRKQFKKIREEGEKGREKLYPHAPAEPTVPLSLPIEEYAGTYRSKAYGRITLSVTSESQTPTATSASKGEDKVLYFLADNKTWTSSLTLEHVNAEFWLGTRGWSDSPIRSLFKAESRAGVDGRVGWFGLAMEEAMPDCLIWFQRES